MTRRGQVRTAVTMILDMIDTLAPHFSKVSVLAARGNHGENRIDGSRTTLDDNDDVMVFELAEMATKRDPRLQHVEYTIADSEVGVFLDVAGWRLATTHGDVYGRGAGGSVMIKAKNWFRGMAAGRDPLGMADVLVTHHFHNHQAAD